MPSRASIALCGILAASLTVGLGPGTAGASSLVLPPGRAWPSLAYDPATQDTVLFGGTNWNNKTFSDTWTFSGTAWTQQHPTTSPSARRGAAMAYDSATGQLLL